MKIFTTHTVRCIWRFASLMCLAQQVSAAAIDAQTITMRADVDVVGVCKILNSRDINFGTLNPQEAADTFAEGGLTFACTRGMDYRLVIDKGQNFDQQSQTRRLISDAGKYYLPYMLKTDGLQGQGSGFQHPLEIQLHANIMAADYKDIPAGSYQDSLRIVFEP